MLTGDIRNRVDQIWNSFWTGGISNPLEVIEQITYLLFIRRLDDLHTLEERKAARLKRPVERRIFPEGADTRGRPYDDFRWSRFRDMAPAEMFAVVGEHVFPLQAAVLLSDPAESFTGGEFVLTEQRPRMQSRAAVVPLRQGDAAVFAVSQRPVRGARGFYRTVLRHGVSPVRSGRRHTLGIIFHDAA